MVVHTYENHIFCFHTRLRSDDRDAAQPTAFRIDCGVVNSLQLCKVKIKLILGLGERILDPPDLTGKVPNMRMSGCSICMFSAARILRGSAAGVKKPPFFRWASSPVSLRGVPSDA